MPEQFRLYLDQMFQLEVAQALRQEGHDVVRASETGQARADDSKILQTSISENRILVTLDEHFGDWVVLPLSQHPGVIRLRVSPTTPEKVLGLLVPLLRIHSSDQLKIPRSKLQGMRSLMRFKNHLVILSQKRSKWVLTG